MKVQSFAPSVPVRPRSAASVASPEARFAGLHQAALLACEQCGKAQSGLWDQATMAIQHCQETHPTAWILGGIALGVSVIAGLGYKVKQMFTQRQA